MPKDDAALLRRWVNCRDIEAFNEIVERFARQVFTTCRRILHNDADAEEISQECFVLLVQTGNDIRCSLGGWLHGVATNKSKERLRQARNRTAREKTYAGLSAPVVEPGWDDLLEHIDAAIEALPEPNRDAIVAHFIERKTHAQIAAESRLSRRAVSYRIARGIELVQTELRRRGVIVSAAVLAASFNASAAAAPLSLLANLGKLALASGGTSPTGGSAATTTLVGSLILMKTKLYAVAAILLLVAAGVYLTLYWPTNHAAHPQAPSSRTMWTPDATDPTPFPTAGPHLAPTTPTREETPTIEDLLALSRAELEQALERYSKIEDPAQYAEVTGVVLDQAGYPISGAEIALVPTWNFGKLADATGMSAGAVSGVDGIYHLENIERTGDFAVSASKAGFTSQAHYVFPKPGNVAVVDFTLHHGVSLEGRVLSPSGDPVPAAFVQCIGLTGPRQLVHDRRRATQTGNDGRFTFGFEEEERGFVTAVRVQSAAHGAATFPDVMVQDERPVELRLAAPGVIFGAVRNHDGKPVPGARIMFYGQKSIDLARADGARWDSPSFTGDFVAVCDGAGRYATEVDAGLDFTATFEAGGIEIDSHAREKLAALHPGEIREYNPTIKTDSIVVRATFVGQQSGRPFASHVPLDAVALSGGREVAQSQPGGHFAVYFVLPESGTYTFQARYLYHGEVKGEMSTPYKLKHGQEIAIELNVPDPQTFTVRVVDPDGNPVHDASVRIASETSHLAEGYGGTNADGRLDQPILVPPYCGAQLMVEKPGYATAWGQNIPDQSPGAVHPEELIVLWPGAGLEGDLVDANSNPLPNIPLTLTTTNRDGEAWPFHVTTDDNGHFTVINQAPADIVDITVTTGDGHTVIGTFNDITLEPGTITFIGAIVLE